MAEIVKIQRRHQQMEPGNRNPSKMAASNPKVVICRHAEMQERKLIRTVHRFYSMKLIQTRKKETFMSEIQNGDSSQHDEGHIPWPDRQFRTAVTYAYTAQARTYG